MNRPNLDEWPNEWHEQCEAEGWAIFNDGDIQRDDAEAIFASDDDAVAFVRAKAAEGSELHKQAIAHITPTCPHCSSHEFFEITRVDVKQRIACWNGKPSEYHAGEEIIWDSAENLDRPYVCAGCGAHDLSIFDLFPDGSES